jgi:HD-like signal output (HDOD) protein
LLRIIDDPDVTVDQIAEIVGADVSLSSALLRLVNSASFGLVRRLTNIREAVQFCGSAEIKDLAIATAVKTRLIGHEPVCHCFDRRRLWRHFVTTALSANLLATRLQHSDRGAAFAAGLLHDMGLLLVDRALPTQLRQVLDVVGRSPVSLEEAEEQVFGFTHGHVGVWIGEHWDIPRTLLTPMHRHDKPWEARRDTGLCAVVHVADFLAMEREPHYRAMERPGLDPRALELLDTTPELVDSVRKDLEQELQRVGSLLELG